MVTSRQPPFFVKDVLQIFRERIGIGSSWTVEEILLGLRNDAPLNYYEFYYLDAWPFRNEFDTLKELLIAVLHSLAELGLVAIDDHMEESSGFQRWRIGNSWRPPEPPFGGGGNADPRDGNDDNDDGGGGLREALGHPVLLALHQDDFDELVNGLFREVRP